MRELACGRCERSFACGVDDGQCWCAELEPVTPPAGYDDCLCPACLAAPVEPPPEAAGALDVRTQHPHAAGELGV